MPLSEIALPPSESKGDELPEIRVAPPGPMSRDALARLARVDCPSAFRRRDARAAASGLEMDPVVFASGKGSNVFDIDGNRFVDLVAGFGALTLGHAAPSVLRTLEAQSERLTLAAGDLFPSDTKVVLCERLAALHPGAEPRVILTQSGSDAVTAALKTAALSTRRPGVLAFEGGYHGLGYAPLAACGYRESFRSPFQAQLNGHVRFAPYPRSEETLEAALEAARAALADGTIGAVLVEPVLGRGGCVVPPDGFLRGLATLAHESGALLIADEVWTGFGRSGAMSRASSLGVPVDLLCFGKAMGGGVSISACVGTGAVMEAWAEHDDVLHTSTHAGNPLAASVAITVLETLRMRRLVVRARELGPTLLEGLRAELTGAPGVVDVRGAGMMFGIELASGGLALRAMRGLLGRGYLTSVGGLASEVLILTPPLNIAEAQLLGVGKALRELLSGALPS